MTYVIREKIFDETGDFIDSREIWRGEQRPEFELKPNQAIFTVVKLGNFDPRLAYPAAWGLSRREGV